MEQRFTDIIQRNICLDSDFHCHTYYSDGRDSIAEMVEAATALGLKKIAITDHVRKDTPWIPKYLKDINCIKIKYKNKIDVLSGFEAKTINIGGEIDAQDSWFNKVDVVLGVIHSIPQNRGFFDGEDVCENKRKLLDAWIKTINALIYNKNVSIVAHPFSEFKIYGLEITSKLVTEFLSLAKRANKPLELSLRHQLPTKELLNTFLNAGTKLVIGSDAHSVNDLYLYHNQKKYYLGVWGAC